MSRFYVRPESVKAGSIHVDGDEAHHILDVMRLKNGDSVAAFDGTGREYYGVIEAIGKKALTIRIENSVERTAQKRLSITLAQAIPKKEKMGYIIEKSVELGVDSIIPMDTERTVVRPKKDKMRQKSQRWKRIVKEAAKQCGRNTITEIEEYAGFKDVLKTAGSYALALMPCVIPAKTERLSDILSSFAGGSILLFIGPEGGFTPGEIASASACGVVLASLGTNVLKCDTAAIAAVSMINYGLGG